MNDAAERPDGLLVLSLWVEPVDRLRVRITRTDDVLAGLSVTSYAATRSEVVRAVEAWLDAFVTPL